MNHTHETPEPESTERPKKPYAPPKVVSYGHVKDIVQGSSGILSDSGSTRMIICWVAEAIYGVTDARTLLLRGWLTAVYAEKRKGWPLVELYRVLGPTVAGLIRSGRLPRRLVRPLFDVLAARAADSWARVVRDGRHHGSV